MRKYMKDNETNILNFVSFKEATIEGYRYGSYYVINSYKTPIAIYSFDTNTWYLSTERFSQVTSRQQSALRLILSDKRVVFLSSDMFHAQTKQVQNEGK